MGRLYMPPSVDILNSDLRAGPLNIHQDSLSKFRRKLRFLAISHVCFRIFFGEIATTGNRKIELNLNPASPVTGDRTPPNHRIIGYPCRQSAMTSKINVGCNFFFKDSAKMRKIMEVTPRARCAENGSPNPESG